MPYAPRAYAAYAAADHIYQYCHIVAMPCYCRYFCRYAADAGDVFAMLIQMMMRAAAACCAAAAFSTMISCLRYRRR